MDYLIACARIRIYVTCGYATPCYNLTHCCKFTRLYWVKLEGFVAVVVMIIVQILHRLLNFLGNQRCSSAMVALVEPK